MNGSRALREFIHRHDIRAAAFDLDDHLVKTNEHAFRRQMDRFSKEVTDVERDIPLPFMKTTVRVANTHVHEDVGVSPERWKRVVEVLGDMLGGSLRPTLRRFLPTLKSIYTIAPGLYPWALETVAEIAQHIPVGINSHGEFGWTIFKLERTGLDRYVSHAHAVPVTQRYKNQRDWHDTAVALGTRPRHLMVGGDSLIADVRPPLEAGVPEQNVFLSESAWGRHNSNGHNVPGGVHTLRGFGDLLPTVARVMQ